MQFKTMDNKVDVGKRIKEARIKKGLTQAQLGELLGIKEIGIRQYEIGRNKPREDRLKQIANALDIDYLYLLTGKNETQKNASGITLLNRIYEAIARKNYTVKRLANEIGVTIEQLNNFLQGIKPMPYEVLKEIANVLGVNYRWICTGYDLSDEQLLNQYIGVTKNNSLTFSDIQSMGMLIKRERQSSILSVEQVAKLLEIEERLLYDFENGDEMIDYNTLFNICSLLQINIYAIINFDENSLLKSHLNKCIDKIDYLEEQDHNFTIQLYNYINEILKK